MVRQQYVTLVPEVLRRATPIRAAHTGREPSPYRNMRQSVDSATVIAYLVLVCNNLRGHTREAGGIVIGGHRADWMSKGSFGINGALAGSRTARSMRNRLAI